MLVEFQRRGRIWTFREFLSSGGRPLISEWYLSLLQPVRAVFDDRLDFLAINERKDWQLPEFRMLRGKEGKAGLSEIRWESEGTQWRVLGFFGLGRMQYTMLIGCTHRQKQYTQGMGRAWSGGKGQLSSMSRPDLLTRLHNREYREAFISSTINSTIAYQIRGLRKLHDLDQAELGNLAGMKQTAISRLENPDYGNLSVKTLKRIAKALDVGLIVRFAPYSEIARWRLTMSRQDMAPRPFDRDLGMHEEDDDLQLVFRGRTHALGVPANRVRDRQIYYGSTVPLQLAFQFDADRARMPFWEDATPRAMARAA